MSDDTPHHPSDAVAPVKGGLVTYLTVDGALKAADFYTLAFGAEMVAALPADEQGRTCHVHLHVNGSSLMLADPYPEYGQPLKPAQGFSLMLPVDDIHAWWERALAAGAESEMPVAEMFWGDLYGQLRDPFGVVWALDQPKGGAAAPPPADEG